MLFRALQCLAVALVVACLASPVTAVPPDQIDCIVIPILTGTAIAHPEELLHCVLSGGSEGVIAMAGTGSAGGVVPPTTKLYGALPTWSCTSAGSPVVAGDTVPDVDPEVRCEPPPGAQPPTCKELRAWIFHFATPPASTEVTAACGPFSTTASASNPVTSVTGTGPFPFSCSVDNAAAQGEGWIVFCFVNL